MTAPLLLSLHRPPRTVGAPTSTTFPGQGAVFNTLLLLLQQAPGTPTCVAAISQP